MQKEESRVEWARSWLLTAIEQSLKNGRRRLPTARTLAKQASVSYVTMWKAVSFLSREEILKAVPGQGITIVSDIIKEPLEHIVPEPNKQEGPRWVVIVNKIQRMLDEGRFSGSDNDLTVKEVASRFGVTHPTARKALNHLALQGILIRSGRTYSSPVRKSLYKSQIVLVAAEESDTNSIMQVTPRTTDHLRILENICMDNGVRLVTRTQKNYLYGQPNFASKDHQNIETYMGPVLGYIVWTIGMWHPEVVELTRRLCEQGKPVSILYEGDLSPLLVAKTSGNKLFHCFINTGEEAGASVGRYLWSLGHRHIAYLSDQYKSEAANKRRNGICSIYTNKSKDCLIKKIDIESEATKMARQFDAALKEKSITAWVLYNDQLACKAVDYLRREGYSVPRDISVCGFDDSWRAMVNKLTSFNFGSHASMNALCNHILHWKSRLKQGKEERVWTVEGNMVERESILFKRC